MSLSPCPLVFLSRTCLFFIAVPVENTRTLLRLDLACLDSVFLRETVCLGEAASAGF